MLRFKLFEEFEDFLGMLAEKFQILLNGPRGENVFAECFFRGQ